MIGPKGELRPITVKGTWVTIQPAVDEDNRLWWEAKTELQGRACEVLGDTPTNALKNLHALLAYRGGFKT